MNERIKQLEKQSYITFKDENSFDCLVFSKEKFAELIVEKCVKCSDPLISHYINNHTEQDQAMLLAAIADYSSEIKKHFGVEE